MRASLVACSFIVVCAVACSDAPAGGMDAGTDLGGPLDPRFFDPCAGESDPVFRWANPDPARVDLARLQTLLDEAVVQDSDAVVIALDDTIVAHKCYRPSTKPQTIQSITKSIVSLAIGVLVTNGKIASLDTPVSVYFPEWADAERAKVTIRHLLTQTSGLADEVVNGVNLLFTAGDALAYARGVHLVRPPGSAFQYCNVGVMLLGGIISQAAGQDAGAFIEEQLLTPIGITDAEWSHDQAGNAMTPGGLFLSTLDLLRLARLVRDDGAWQGTPLVPASWVQLTTSPQTVAEFPCYGYLWWMVRDNCDADTGLSGEAGPLLGFTADGYGGNYATVIPTSRVSGVRTKKQLSSDQTVVQKASFNEFPRELARLTP